MHGVTATLNREEVFQLSQEGYTARTAMDTASETAYLQIIPKGKFTYHPKDGFSGEAVKVTILAKTQRKMVKQQTTSLRAIEAKQLDEKLTASTQERQLLKEKAGVSLGPVAAISLAVLLSVFFIYWIKRWRNS